MFAASKTAAAAAGTPPPSTDPQFNYVTMLLHGDGTNGAQNNTFVDSSTNNFTITRNGTPTQGSFSPYGDLWSNFFNGTTDYISAPANAAFNFGSGDFTAECWVNLRSFGSGSRAFAQTDALGLQSDTSILLDISSSGVVTGYVSNGTSYISRAGSASITTNTWNHIAMVRNGTELRMYVNGAQSASTSLSGVTLPSSSQPFTVGRNGSNNGLYTNGYIANVRIVKGTALYTSNFTPSTTPLTAVSGTSLLTCQSNRFRDNSSNNFAITVTGTPSVQRFSPFDPAAEYSTSVIGGSAYIPGTTNYLSTSGSAIAVGAGAFTLEGWVYLNNVDNGGFGSLCSSVNSSTDRGVSFILTGSSGWRFRIGRASPGQFEDFLVATPLVRYHWNHVKIVRTSTGTNDTRVYLNGVQQAIGTSTININFTQFAVGRFYPSENTTTLDGYVSNVRLTNTAESSAVPTAPLIAVTGTALLLNTVNAGIFDNAMMNDLVTVGNAQVSTAVKKYGTGSMAFDGTGDWLTFVDSPNVQLGAGDFTIEGWVYLSALGTARGFLSKGTSTTGFSFGVNALNQLVFNYTATSLTATTPLLISTWYYVAVVRSGSATGNLKIYLNGSVDATSGGAVNDNFNQTSIGYVGADRVATSPMNGYIDDLRITKGIARTITTPTAAFPNN